MNEHDHIRDQLFAYLEDPTAHREVTAHVVECASCAADLAITRRANEAFAKVPQAPLPEGFMERLRARLPEEVRREPLPPTEISSSTRRGRRAFWTRTVLGIAAVFALAFGGLLLTMPKPAPSPFAEVAERSALIVVGHDLELGDALLSNTAPLRLGSALETTNHPAVIRLGEDGSLRLDAGTRVRVLALFRASETTILKIDVALGRVWVEDGTRTRVIIHTPDALMGSPGAALDVRVTPGGTHVRAWRGTIALNRLRNRRLTVLQEGQQAVIDAKGTRVGNLSPVVQQDPWYQWNRRLQVPSQASGPLETPPLGKASPFPLPWMK